VALPDRERLPHEIPPWVTRRACFFVTICAAPRTVNQLTTEEASPRILDSVRHYHSNGAWWLHGLLLMPDHLHALLSVAPDRSLSDSVRAWKSWQAKTSGVVWQPGFFDHRVRNDESFEEKAHYLRQNPVRAGLIRRAEHWPYVWPAPSR
jgi:putative transposase